MRLLRRMVVLIVCSVLVGCAAYGQFVSDVTAPAAKAHAEAVHNKQRKGP